MKALFIVDVQYDFLEGGKLAVPNGLEIINPILAKMDSKKYEHMITSMDWHPFDHISFDEWPEHCVQYTPGACTHEAIERKIHEWVKSEGTYDSLFKGEDIAFDEYSAVNSNRWVFKGLDEIEVVGLATDYCVKATVLDLLTLRKRVIVDLSCCRGVDPKTTLEAIEEMKRAGAKIV